MTDATQVASKILHGLRSVNATEVTISQIVDLLEDDELADLHQSIDFLVKSRTLTRQFGVKSPSHLGHVARFEVASDIPDILPDTRGEGGEFEVTEDMIEVVYKL